MVHCYDYASCNGSATFSNEFCYGFEIDCCVYAVRLFTVSLNFPIVFYNCFAQVMGSYVSKKMVVLCSPLRFSILPVSADKSYFICWRVTILCY